MYIFYGFFFFIHFSYSQFNITAFSQLPSLSFTQQFWFSAIRKNATEVYTSVRQGSIPKIVKWNTTTATNATRMGEYLTPINLAGTFSYLYFIKGYVIGSSESSRAQVFNETNFSYLGETNVNLTFGRGEFINTKDVFFFGTATGNVGYFSVNNLPNISPVYLFNESLTNFVFAQKSLDQSYISVSFINSNYILIYQTSDWSLVKNVTVSSVGVYTQAWSGDGRYLMVFLYHEIYVLVYDRDSNWTLVKNHTIGYKNIRTCFHYEQTNIVVAMSQFSSAIILINWYDYSTSYYFSINGWKMYRSDTKESMTIFQHSSRTSWYFNINKFCPQNKFYSIPLKTCAECDLSCQICNSTISCQQCVANYTVVNGTCQACPLNSIYNVTSYMCDSCIVNCLTCLSTSICSSCIEGGSLVNGSCVLCALGHVYNFTVWQCQVNCTTNCVTCATNSSCSVCSTGYNLMSNGKCMMCNSSSFYNSTDQTCESCSQNCDTCSSAYSCDSCVTGAQLSSGSCVVCPANCISCQTNSQCTQCNIGYEFYQNQCRLQNQISHLSHDSKLYEITMAMAFQSDVIVFMNKVPGSRRIIRQVFGFFMNIDHLWLYIYHKRQYGQYVERLLKAVQNLEQEKWNMISDNVLNQTLGLDVNVVVQYLNFKVNRTSWKYRQVEDKSSSFLQNSVDYFLLNVPLVVGVFFLFKFLFNILFNFQISLFFREYAFNGYLLLMLIEGNYESFSYLFMYDCSQLVQLNLPQKILNIITLIFYGVFVTQLIAGFFLIKASYNKHAKYFYDNCSNTIQGSTHLLVQCGLLNFGLGAVHLMPENFYRLQLLMLFCVETLYISFVVFSLKKCKVYEFKYIQWQNVLASLVRILLILTYYADQNAPGVYETIQQSQMCLIIIYLVNWILSTVISTFLMLKKVISFILKNFISKGEISTLYKNPSLSRFKILARRQPKKKKKIIIQIIDEHLNDNYQKGNMKIQMTVKDKANNTQIAIIHKIKMYRNKKTSLQKSKTLGLNKKLSNLSSFFTQKEPPQPYKNKNIVFMPSAIVQIQLSPRNTINQNQSRITSPGHVFTPSQKQLNQIRLKVPQQHQSSNVTLKNVKINKNYGRGLTKGTSKKIITI